MDPIVAGTLAWCNERRAEKQLEPLPDLPKGIRGDPTSCPCGAATGLYVENTGFYAASKDDYYQPVTEGAEVVRVVRNPTLERYPVSVQHFVLSFDQGEYPQYQLAEDEG